MEILIATALYWIGAGVTVYIARRWVVTGRMAEMPVILSALFFWPLALPAFFILKPLHYLYWKAAQQRDLADNRKRMKK